MRLFLVGPRIFGLRPGLAFNPFKSSGRTESHNTQRGSFVYLIQNPEGFVKIGVSNNPLMRLAHLQIANTGKLTLLHSIAIEGDSSNAYLVEDLVHRELASLNEAGEWFHVDGELGVHAIESAAQKLGLRSVEVERKDLALVIREAALSADKESSTWLDRAMARLIQSVLALVLFVTTFIMTGFAIFLFYFLWTLLRA